MKQFFFPLMLAGALLMSLVYCKKDDDGTSDCPDCPFITALIPNAGSPGDTVTITGQNFSGVQHITFGATEALPLSGATANTLRVIAPDLGVNGPVNVRVVRQFTSGSGSTVTLLSEEKVFFTYAQSPVITGFSPASGKKGDVVTITGKFFSVNPRVYFANGEATEIIQKSDTLIRVTVPAKAGSGAIRVVNAEGLSDTSALAYEHQLAFSLSLFLGAPGQPGSAVNVPANQARLTRITHIADDKAGNVYIVDQYDFNYFDVIRIDKSPPFQTTKVISQAPGSCRQLFIGDQGQINYILTNNVSGLYELYTANSGALPVKVYGPNDYLAKATTRSNGEVYLILAGYNGSFSGGIFSYDGSFTNLESSFSIQGVPFIGKLNPIDNGFVYTAYQTGFIYFYHFDFLSKERTSLFELGLVGPEQWTISAFDGKVYFEAATGIRV